MGEGFTDKMRYQLELVSQTAGCPLYLKDHRVEVSFPGSGTDRDSSPFLCDPEFAGQFSKMDSELPFLYQDKGFPDIYYGCLCREGMTVIAGPVSRRKLPVNSLILYMRDHQINDVKNYLIQRKSVRKICDLLSLIYSICVGETIAPEELMPKTGALSKVALEKDSAFMEMRLKKEEENEQHFPYWFEDRMMECIRTGEYPEENLKEILFRPEQFSSGTLASSELKDVEYKTVGLLSLFLRAAISGGVNPYEAYDIGDIYIYKVSCAQTIQEYNDIRTACFVHLCKAVRQAKLMKENNLHVEKCKHFLAKHISRPFTFDELVDYVGVNKSYLSKIFRREEGKTITEYMLEERITAAQHMLRFSDYSTAQIANYLCFSDQSYFCRVFKKITGTTPANYRKQHKSTSF